MKEQLYRLVQPNDSQWVIIFHISSSLNHKFKHSNHTIKSIIIITTFTINNVKQVLPQRHKASVRYRLVEDCLIETVGQGHKNAQANGWVFRAGWGNSVATCQKVKGRSAGVVE